MTLELVRTSEISPQSKPEKSNRFCIATYSIIFLFASIDIPRPTFWRKRTLPLTLAFSSPKLRHDTSSAKTKLRHRLWFPDPKINTHWCMFFLKNPFLYLNSAGNPVPFHRPSLSLRYRFGIFEGICNFVWKTLTTMWKIASLRSRGRRRLDAELERNVATRQETCRARKNGQMSRRHLGMFSDVFPRVSTFSTFFCTETTPAFRTNALGP